MKVQWSAYSTVGGALVYADVLLHGLVVWTVQAHVHSDRKLCSALRDLNDQAQAALWALAAEQAGTT